MSRTTARATAPSSTLAQRRLGNRFGFYRPAGGFFLWLDVGDGEAACRRLWREGGVRVLPGGYLVGRRRRRQCRRAPISAWRWSTSRP